MHTYSLCRMRVRLAKQETMTLPGHRVRDVHECSARKSIIATVNMYFIFVASKGTFNYTWFKYILVFILDILISMTLDLSKTKNELHLNDYIRGWIKKFWNYSHISLNIRRNYIKLIQSTKLTCLNFAVMFERRSTQGEMWRHCFMTSWNSDPVRKMTEIFLSKRKNNDQHLCVVWRDLLLD